MTPQTRSRRSKPATFYVVQGSADIRWRAEMPAKAIGAKLTRLTEKQAPKVFSEPNDGRLFPWQLTDTGAEYPQHEGTAVWVRPDMVRATHALAMKAETGCRVLAEVDDNYLSNPSQNIFMRINNYDAQGRKNHMLAFASMDGIICSTEELRNEYHATFKSELGYAPEMFVARNHVNPKDWEGRQEILPPSSAVRVGWMGSHQHVWDLRLAAPALRLASDLGCEVVLIGLDPADHDPNWRNFLTYTHIPWFDPKLYHRSVLNFDIGLIPLVYNKHTMGKSDVKFLEYSMSGAATIAQNMPVYNRTIKHGETGLLAGSPDEMAEMMYELIKKPHVRNRIASAAKQYVLENRTIQGNLHEWKDPL